MMAGLPLLNQEDVSLIHTTETVENLDLEWIELIKMAIEVNISKEEVTRFLLENSPI